MCCGKKRCEEIPDDNKERPGHIWSNSIGFDVQIGFTKGGNVFTVSRLAFPFHRHLDYGVSSLKKIIINLRLWYQWKVLLFFGKICTNGFFLGTHNQQCCSAAAVVVVIVFASLRCLPDPFSLGIVRLWEFTVGRNRSLVVLPGGWLIKGWAYPCTVPH